MTFDIHIRIDERLEVITISGAEYYKGDKGEKGDPFIYTDFTQEQLDDLMKPANDKVADIELLESKISSAEAIRVDNEADRQSAEVLRVTAESARVTAEIDRQTNTATAITNANDAATNANTKAGLADTATENANEATEQAIIATQNAIEATDSLLSNIISLEIRDDLCLWFETPPTYDGITFDITNGNLIATI